MSDNLKIAVCTHVFRGIDYTCYFNHLWCCSQWAKNYDLVFVGRKGLDAATSRNQIVDAALTEDCTHLFFMDGDHLFPSQALPLLLECKDEAMVSGLVCKRGGEYDQVVYMKTDEGRYIPTTLPLDGRVYQVHICAFGCTLINVRHLQKLEKPYFRDTCRELPDKSMYNFRSDVNLCEAFMDIKERCFVDTRVLIGHHGFDTVIYPQQAPSRVSTDKILLETMRLSSGQEGFYYEP